MFVGFLEQNEEKAEAVAGPSKMGLDNHPNEQQPADEELRGKLAVV